MLRRAQECRDWRRRYRSVAVGPFGGNQRLTSIRQDEYKLQAGWHARLAEDFERLPMQRMMRASDGDAFGKVLMMGSVWWCSSTISITNGW